MSLIHACHHRFAPLAERLDALSFYDDTLHADTSYSYRVIAIDEQGHASDPETVSIEIRLKDRLIGTDTTPWSLWSDALVFKHVIHDLWPPVAFPDASR